MVSIPFQKITSRDFALAVVRELRDYEKAEKKSLTW